ncbi:MAG: hypothetical protein SGARI_001510 [Bacillariaceae sp.]
MHAAFLQNHLEYEEDTEQSVKLEWNLRRENKQLKTQVEQASKDKDREIEELKEKAKLAHGTATSMISASIKKDIRIKELEQQLKHASSISEGKMSMS